MSILTYVLHYEGEFNKNSLGAVSEGARIAGELGGECHVLVLGGDDLSDDFCGSLGGHGAAKVFRVKGAEGLAQPVVDAMAKVMDSGGHRYALFGGGLLGYEIGAVLAARLNLGVTSISTSRYRERGIVIGRLNAFEAKETGGTATVEDVQVDFSEFSTRSKMVTRGEQRGASCAASARPSTATTRSRSSCRP